MMRLIFSTLLCLCPSVHALKSATGPEMDEILRQRQIAADSSSRAAHAEDFLARVQGQGWSDAQIHALELDLQRKKDSESAAYTKMLHMIIKAYDIAPPKTKGTSVMPWTKGREIEWIPVAREREEREVRNKAGKSKTVPKAGADKRYYATTYVDGTTYFDIEELKRLDTARIASVLLHEGVHLTQFITNGDTMSSNERQRDAHQAELNAAKLILDPQNKDHQEFLKDAKNLHDAYAMAAEQDKNARIAEGKTIIGIVKRRLNEVFPSPESLYEPRPLSQAQLDSLKRQASDIRRAIEKEEDERKRRAWKAGHLRYLHEIAAAGCSGHGLDQANFDSMRYADRAFYLRAEARFWTDHRGERTCADFLYASFLTHLATHDKLDARLLTEFQRGHLDGIRNFARRACAGERVSTQDYDAIWYFEGRKLYARESDRVVREATGRLSCEEEQFTSDLGWLAAGRLPPEPARAEPIAEPPKIEAPNANDPPRAYAEPVRVPASADADLETLAKAACADPAGLERRTLPDLHWFPYPDVNLGRRSRARWTECEGRVYDHLLGMNAGWKSLDLDEIRRVARPPAPPAPLPAQPVAGGGSPTGGCGPANRDTGIVGCPQN